MAINDNSSDPTDSKEWKLISKARESKDERAFGLIFRKYKDSLYLTIFHMVKNEDVAEDLLMEVFTKVFSNLGQYQPTHKFETWLSTVARNHTLDYLRKKKPNQFSLDREMEYGEGYVLLQVEDADPNPEITLLEKESKLSVISLVEQLKPRYKVLIKLRYFDELSYDEIAQKLELPLGTVKAQLFRAKELLQQIIKNSNQSFS